MVTKVESYIKGEERNTKKKAREFKERVPNSKDSYHQRKSNYTSSIKYKITFKIIGKTMESLTPLNTRHEHNRRGVLHIYNTPTSPAPKVDVMDPEPGRWCKDP